ncbi:unannotated protein [freshwater metagenome]|uniref:Unannotated protein n=1 Tax=freshwater metagenome TaxID=449393 RepID=A0A6J6J482_9ZZZZ
MRWRVVEYTHLPALPLPWTRYRTSRPAHQPKTEPEETSLLPLTP